MQKEKIADIKYSVVSVIFSYVLGVFLVSREVSYHSITWAEAFAWPIAAMMWCEIVPGAFLFFLLFAAIVVRFYKAKSRKPFRISVFLLMSLYAFWMNLTLVFHD